MSESIKPRGDMVEGWKAPQSPDNSKQETASSREAGVPATELEHGIEAAMGKSAEELKEQIRKDAEEAERLQPV